MKEKERNESKRTLKFEVRVKEVEEEEGWGESKITRVPSEEAVANLLEEWFQAEQRVPLSNVAIAFSIVETLNSLFAPSPATKIALLLLTSGFCDPLFSFTQIILTYKNTPFQKF